MPISGSDDFGRPFSFEEPPQRIISLAPSNTEILFALGLGDRVVGVTDFCDYPPQAEGIESVGSPYPGFSMETIVDLEPDLVIVVQTKGISELEATQKELVDQLEGLGIAVVAINPSSLDKIISDIQLIGKIGGVEEKGSELVAQMQSRIDAVLAKTEEAPRPWVFYDLFPSDPSGLYTAGPGSFIDALMVMAGGENVVESPGDWVSLSHEELVNLDPEIILLGDGSQDISVDIVNTLPGWQELSAVKEGRVYIINNDLVTRPGPRIVDGLEELANALHPELFE